MLLMTNVASKGTTDTRTTRPFIKLEEDAGMM